MKQFTTSYSGFYFPGFALLCCRVGCEGRGTPGESGMSPGRFIVFGGKSWRDLVLLEKNRKLPGELEPGRSKLLAVSSILMGCALRNRLFTPAVLCGC